MEIKYHIKEAGGYIFTIENYLDKNYADQLFQACHNLDLVKNPKVRTGICHRRVGFYSDTVSGYYFSGQKTPSKPLVPFLRDLLLKIATSFSESYKSVDTSPSNAILINEYLDGEDYIGSHSDSEKDLDPRIIIAISLGSPRTFRIRRKNKTQINGGNYLDIKTSHGQLLVMGGGFLWSFSSYITQLILDQLSDIR